MFNNYCINYSANFSNKTYTRYVLRVRKYKNIIIIRKYKYK